MVTSAILQKNRVDIPCLANFPFFWICDTYLKDNSLN
jgi:hypothetical protein